jgi:RHS repeat-associated protein
MSSLQPVLLCRFHYDPLDRLTSHIQPNSPPNQRFYCKSRLATEIQGTLSHSIVQQGDLLLAEQCHEGGVVDNTTLLGTDQQRSVLHMLKNNLPQRDIAYSPYGHHQNVSGLTNLLGFNGERADPVTGHYPLGNGYRDFNPVLMRFNSPDSWSPFGGGGLNAYAYCKGNPVLRTDPTGHAPVMSLAKLFKLYKDKSITLVGKHAADMSSVQSLGGNKGAMRGINVTNNERILNSSVAKRPDLEVFDTFIVGDGEPALVKYTADSNDFLENITQSNTSTWIPEKHFSKLVFVPVGSPPLSGGGGGGGGGVGVGAVPRPARPVQRGAPVPRNISPGAQQRVLDNTIENAQSRRVRSSEDDLSSLLMLLRTTQ